MKEAAAILKKKEVYIFGAGLLGKAIYGVLKYFDCFVAFIDNDLKKQKNGFMGERVISLNEYLLSNQEAIIVIEASQKNKSVIIRQLEDKGLENNKDFFLREYFEEYLLPIIALYNYDKIYISLAQIVLTERCTLKCKKCAHACYAVDNRSKDLTLEQVYKSADSFFSKVDYIKEFVLIGGEPLIYKNLDKAIEYIGEKYRHQINMFSITTNGTITPKENTLKLCKKYGVVMRISNYSKQVPRLKEAYKKLIKELEKNDVLYEITSEEFEWTDFGFEYVNRNGTEEELKKVFEACKTPCKEVRENKLYYCVMARSVSDNLKFNVGKDDYLDLDTLGEEYRERLLRFNLGYLDKGYLDMCNYCHGAEAINFPIPAAEQLI